MRQPKIIESLTTMCAPLKGYIGETVVNYELWDRSYRTEDNVIECFHLHDAVYFPGSNFHAPKNNSYSAQVEIIRDQKHQPYAQISLVKGAKTLTIDTIGHRPNPNLYLRPEQLTPVQTEKLKSVKTVMREAVAKLSAQTQNPLFADYCRLFGVTPEEIEQYRPKTDGITM